MKKPYRILLVEDSLFILEGYRALLDLMEEKFEITEAQNIDQAIEKIERQTQEMFFDLAFVDIQLPKSKRHKIESGEEIALLLKKKNPQIKIIVLTQYNQPARIRYIMDTVAPDGLLLKDEFRGKQVHEAVKSVLMDNQYFSSRVQMMMKKDNLDFDLYDLKILKCLEKGVKVKDIQKEIPLSQRAIEDRKSTIIIKLDIPSGDRVALIEVARELGLI